MIAIIGDVHGCIEEFRELITLLKDKNVDKIVSVGDLTDKGPDSNAVVEHAAKNNVILVNSNHDNKYIEFIKKNRAAGSIQNEHRREIYKSLSHLSKEYLLTAKPYIQFKYLKDKKESNFLVVHGGIGPNHTLSPLNGNTFNAILRLRYVDKDTLEKVSTIYNIDGSWGPEHDNVWKWQEVYHGQYGPVFHGHIVENMSHPVYWLNGKVYPIENGRTISLNNDSLIFSIDTGCVYGGSLTAAIVAENGEVEFRSVKALKEYAK